MGNALPKGRYRPSLVQYWHQSSQHIPHFPILICTFKQHISKCLSIQECNTLRQTPSACSTSTFRLYRSFQSHRPSSQACRLIHLQSWRFITATITMTLPLTEAKIPFGPAASAETAAWIPGRAAATAAVTLVAAATVSSSTPRQLVTPCIGL